MPSTVVVNQPAVTPRTAAGVEIDFATEAKLEAVRVLIASLEAKDFSTETTLNNFLTAFNGTDFATQTTLAALLAAFNAEDFSSETTLAALKAAFDAEDFASETTLAAFKAAFDAEDFASETTLAAFKAAFDAEDFATQTTLAALLSAFNAEDFASETTLAAADAKLATIDAVLDSIKDVDGIKKITDPVVLGAGDSGIGRVKVWDGTQVAEVYSNGDSAATPLGFGILGRDDNAAAKMLLTELDGTLKVATKPAAPPANATAVIYVGDTPLDLNTQTSPHDTDGPVIGAGINFYLQSIYAGAAGDPSEDGSVGEIYWVENGTEHLVARIYLLGQTIQFSFPDLNITRDGTQMIGDGSTTFIRVRRERLSNALQAVDVEVLGYTE